MSERNISCAEACYASKLLRLLEGYCIDPLLYSVPVYMLMRYLTKRYVSLNDVPEIVSMMPSELQELYGTLTWGYFLQALIVNVFAFLFFFLFEALAKGKTPGKYMCRTVVVDINGNRPPLWRLLLRTICRFIPFDAFSFLLGGQWVDGRLRGAWHDKLSGTYVVEARLLEMWKSGSYDGSDRLSAMIQSIMQEQADAADDQDADDQDTDGQDTDGQDYDGYGNSGDGSYGEGGRRLRVEDLYPSDDDDDREDGN